MAIARIQAPASARRGEVIEVRIAVQHPMETGFRFDLSGRPVPRNVINQLVCRYAGAEVFRAELGSGIAANPLIAFHTVARESGELAFEWVDDRGERGAQGVAIAVSG